MRTSDKSIWIDLDNSPHVPLFVPIIRHYREKGIEIIVTARQHSQTLELLDLHEFNGTYEVVGRHHGKGKFSKIFGTLARARQLITYIKKSVQNGSEIAVAVSHGSRAMVLAARWLKIPVITMYDYEFTETAIFNHFSTRVLVPDKIPDSALDEIGLRREKRVKYPGIKEELYIRSFEADSDFRRKLFESNNLKGLEEKIFVVLRPPATTANYHSTQSETLFDALLSRLLNDKGAFTIITPRTAEQAAGIRTRIADSKSKSTSYLILDKAVNGLQLAFAADVLISGGGTMNREAALLGVPVYSIFAGKLGALDAQMEKEGLITFVRSVADIAKIKLVRSKTPAQPNSAVLTDRVERFVIEQIDAFLKP